MSLLALDLPNFRLRLAYSSVVASILSSSAHSSGAASLALATFDGCKGKEKEGDAAAAAVGLHESYDDDRPRSTPPASVSLHPLPIVGRRTAATLAKREHGSPSDPGQ